MDNIQNLIDQENLRNIVTDIQHAIDRRKFESWMNICIDGIEVEVTLERDRPYIAQGKDAVLEILSALYQYERTTHFLGSFRAWVNGNEAVTHTYCMAYHLKTVDGRRSNVKWSQRYEDSFTRHETSWLMTKRKLFVDWTEIFDSVEPDINKELLG